jgi:ABC-type transporter Mla MlaB component
MAALGSVVLVLSGPLALGSVGELCEAARLLLETTGAGVLTCDVGAIGRPDAGTVDVLARVALTARRLGRSIHLLDPCPQLQALLALTGLEVALPYSLSPPPERA